jgi:uncharacterized membrane protein
LPGEKESWRTTVMVLIAISLVIGIIQRTSYMFLDPKFEVCIFHVPTILSIIIYSRLPESSNSQV